MNKIIIARKPNQYMGTIPNVPSQGVFKYYLITLFLTITSFMTPNVE